MDSQQLDMIEKRVRDAIRQGAATAAREQGGNRHFTRLIKESLAQAGRELGYGVCTSLPGADYPEWIWDLSWVKERKAEGHTDLVVMPLVVESEWIEDIEEEILPDFQKLMVGRAWLRVMICQAPDSQTRTRYFDRLREAIGRYSGTQAGDRYLFACWNYQPAVWDVEFENYVA